MTKSIEERITDALTPFGDDIDPAVYMGSSKQYYTFNYNTIGADFADDAPNHERYLIQVHFFAPLGGNITARKHATQQALYTAGFTWPETLDLSDEMGRHIVFECEEAGGI